MLNVDTLARRRRSASRAGALPNLVIIGAMKCGTTSLHYYLDHHPQIAMSTEKELEFFIEERTWKRGIDWYAAQFDASAAIRGEASPNYTASGRFPGVPARMHSVVPDARIIYMVRDPVERLVSQYVHNYSHGREGRSLGEAVRDDPYLDRSRYSMQLSAYLEHYPASRIRVVEMEDLRDRRAATLRGVFEFLGVDPEFTSPRFSVQHNRSARKRRKTRLGAWIARTGVARGIETLPARVRWLARDLLYLPVSRPIERLFLEDGDRHELIERLRPDAERFRALTGRDFASWCV